MVIGTNPLLLPLHNPVDLAEQYATIDIIAGGRSIPGIGVGYRPVEAIRLFGHHLLLAAAQGPGPVAPPLAEAGKASQSRSRSARTAPASCRGDRPQLEVLLDGQPGEDLACGTWTMPA